MREVPIRRNDIQPNDTQHNDSILGLFATLTINDTINNDNSLMSVVMLSVIVVNVANT